MKSSVWARRLPQRRGDRGATLVIALIIVTTIALVTGAVLSHTWTNSAATITFRGVASTSYAGDAAAKVAINELRLGSSATDWVNPAFSGTWNDWGWVFTNNSDSTGCFGATGTAAAPVLTNTLELDGSALAGFYPKTADQPGNSSARVECTPVAGTGILSSDGVDIGDTDPNSTDPFARALTTLGTAPDPNGVDVKVLGVLTGGVKAAAPIGGGILSKSTVNIDNGYLATNGYVWAAGACTGSGSVVSPDTECPKSGGVLTPDVPASPITTVPALVDPSTLVGCHFPAGSYINGGALTTKVHNCGISYFDDTSGPYYFDFADSGNQWKIDTQVIAGHASGSTAIPGSCLSPITNDPVTGVQFVFGGASNIYLANGANVEICGPSNSGNAPLTIFQQQTAGPSATSTPTATATTLPDVTVGPFGPTTLANGSFSSLVNTGKQSLFTPTSSFPTTWTAANSNYTGELDMSGFTGIAVPMGATITSAKLNVTYTNSGTTAPKVGVTDGAATVGSEVALASSGSDTTLTSQFQTLVSAGALGGAARPKLYIVIPASSKNKTMTVSQATLTIVYNTTAPVPPTTVTIEPATSGTFIKTQSNFSGKFVVQGATYAPQGYLDIDAGNSASLVALRWGLVAQGVVFKTFPQQLFGYPLVSIPNPGHGLGSRATAVDLKVYVCVGAATCATGGRQSLNARVVITDPPYNTGAPYKNTPEPGRRQVRIISWAEQH